MNAKQYSEALVRKDKRIGELEAMLRLAASDYWREQMDGLDSDRPVDHIIEATIEKWRNRVEVERGQS